MEQEYHVRIYDERGVVRCGVATRTHADIQYQTESFTRRGITQGDLPELERIIKGRGGLNPDKRIILAFEGSLENMRELYNNLKPVEKK